MPDHFAAFVERLAAGLDDVPHQASELAAQAHLSRYHFERVVAAASGESPTRFRDRLLMERAAYRMVAGDDGLLDLAVQAGFSSHEAFTRAFRREYGQAPSRWRRRPGSFRIDAPSDVHFHPPGGLRLPARDRMSGVDLVVEMVEHHVWLVGQLVDRAQHLADDELDRPIAGPLADVDGDSLRWALSRLVGQMAMWNAAVDDAGYDFAVEVAEPVASVRARLDDTGPRFVANVRRFADEERFDETFVEAFTERPVVLTYGAMVAHVLTFAAHHRLLAVTRLRELGVTDLGLGDPKQWFDVGR
ncbi:AraC family transcriptional regulator [Angustibacter peucedani]